MANMLNIQYKGVPAQVRTAGDVAKIYTGDFSVTDHSMRRIGVKKPLAWDVKENGCWDCISHHCNPPIKRYPKIMIDGVLYAVHRYVYQLHYGPILPGFVIRHKCDNTICVNPKHLEIGTQWDNIQDQVRRGRTYDRRGEKNPKAKLTKANVDEIRASKESNSILSLKFGVSAEQIGLIRRWKSWC